MSESPELDATVDTSNVLCIAGIPIKKPKLIRSEEATGKNTCELRQKKMKPSGEVIEKPKQNYKCCDCGSIFSSTLLRDRHSLTHPRKHLEQNDQCGQILPQHNGSEQMETISTSAKPVIKSYFERDTFRWLLQSQNDNDTVEPPDVNDVKMPAESSKCRNCKECKCTFKTATALLEHKCFHTDELHENIEPLKKSKMEYKKEWKCKKCGFTFEKKFELKRHSCKILAECSNKMLREGEEQSASKRYCKTRAWKCKVCQVTFKKKYELSSHMTVHSSKPKKNKWKCVECNDCFAYKMELTTHKNSLHKKWNCGECHMTLESKSSLRSHIQSSHVLNRQFVCDECNVAYVHEAALVRHKKRAHMVGEFPCKHCDQLFSTFTTLTVHLRTHRLFICKVCPASYTQQGHLDTHSLKHSNKRYECEECGGTFIRNEYLKLHLRSHTLERSYKCDQCSRSFLRKSHLRTHALTHSVDRPFKCNQCNASFNQKAGLNLHLHTHNGEKPFKCDKCYAAFARKGDLQRHMDLHIGRKPFKCTECQFTCARKGNLKVHMRIHTGERPYKCSECNHASTNKSDLTKHIKVVHEEVNFDTDEED